MIKNLDIEKIREVLEKHRAALVKDLGGEEKVASERRASNPDRTDLAWNYYQSERNSALEERFSEQLDQVEAALKRIESGTYGRCTRCGKEINSERLEALPHAALCIECQVKQEQRS